MLPDQNYNRGDRNIGKEIGYGKCETINLQAELAACIEEYFGKTEEETAQLEVFFGEIGEIANMEQAQLSVDERMGRQKQSRKCSSQKNCRYRKYRKSNPKK